MICAPGEVKVFHITTLDKVEEIKRDGLKSSCHIPTAFGDIFVKERRCSNYAWADLAQVIYEITDDHPTDYPPPVVEVCLDENIPVYNMQLMNKAQQCVWGSNNMSKEELATCIKVYISEWRESAIPLKDYKKGQYRKPEVIFGDVPVDKLHIAPMVEASISKEEMENIRFFITQVDNWEKYKAEHPPEEEGTSTGARRFEDDWEALEAQQWAKLKDLLPDD